MSLLQCPPSAGAIVSIDRLCTFHGISNDIATFDAGCTVKYALERLSRVNRQLYGFGGIAEQRLGGAISTSLHGQHTTPFTNHLVGVSAILANGSMITLDRTHPEFGAWPGSMGMLGVVVQVKLRVWPLQHVECTSRSSQTEADLAAALANTAIVGFLAQRQLYEENAYTIQTCIQVESDELVTFVVKDNPATAFVHDNVLLSAVTFLGILLTQSHAAANFVFRKSVRIPPSGSVASINHFRNPVSYSPFFDEEYAVPNEKCHETLEQIRALSGGLAMMAYLRRVDAGNGWLNWAPTASCAFRVEDYLDYGNFDAVRSKTQLRLKIEAIVIRNGGSGHFGKVWHGNASALLTNSVFLQSFEKYRHGLDPTGKFQNDYTREIRGQTTNRSYPVLPVELEVRAHLWRASIWSAVAGSFLAAILIRKQSHMVS